MTEQEWLVSTDPAAMLKELELRRQWLDTSPPHPHRPSGRKLRLFACAACRVSARVRHPAAKDWRKKLAHACDLGERMADGEVVEHTSYLPTMEDALAAAESAANVYPNEAQETADAARCVFGNPWRPVTLPRPRLVAAPARVNVLALAAAAYESPETERCGRCGGTGELSCAKCSGEGCSPHALATNGPCTAGDLCPDCSGTGRASTGRLDAGALGVLADALEEAGCADAAMLAHLRSGKPHWCGCWVVDLLTGR